MVLTGHGDIDSYLAKVVSHGNLVHKPKVKHWSKGKDCPTTSQMIDNDNKTMIVLKGKTNAPVREDDWEYFLNYGYDKYKDVDTTVKVKSADDGYGVDIISSIQDDANYHNFIAVN